MNIIFDYINPETVFFAGLIGLAIMIIFLFHFTRKRILRLMGNKQVKVPGASASLRNLVTITFFSAVSGLLIFMGLFFRAYHTFTYEEPVAEIEVAPKGDGLSVIKIKELASDTSSFSEYEIQGDQWMLEGDILKWENFMNFLGLHTQYRITRIRGRYIKTSDELNKPATIYSLVEDEDNPFWSTMYDIGFSLPFVSTVYGNAAFQMTNKKKKFDVFVTTSGFIIREKPFNLDKQQ